MSEPQDQEPQPRGRARFRGNFLGRLRANLLTGMVVVVPIATTAYITWTVIDFVDSTVLPRVRPLIPEAWLPHDLLPFSVPGMGLVVIIVSLVLIGSLTRNLFGRELLRWGERWVDRMPIVRSIYNALKQISETIFAQSGGNFEKACMIEYPRKGVWAVAFISTEARGEVPLRAGKEMLSVFLPTTPNPTSGFLLFVPKEDVVYLSMTVEEAAKLIISAGLITPPMREALASPQHRQPPQRELEATARPGLGA